MVDPLETHPSGDTLTAVALDLPFDVVVWDDPVTLMVVVTRILMKVFGYQKNQGTPAHDDRPPRGPGSGVDRRTEQG